MKSLDYKIKKYGLMREHKKLVKSGKFDVAKNILVLLLYGTIRLGVSDCDWATEKLLEEIGFQFSYTRNYTAIAYLKNFNV